VDTILAIKNSFLELNPVFTLLSGRFGEVFAWILVIFFKFALIASAIFLVNVNKQTYKTERKLFFISTLFAFFIIAQMYGVYTGVKADLSVNAIEERDGPISLEVKDMIKIEHTAPYSIKTTPTRSFYIAILPLIISNLAFYIFEKLYPLAKIKKPRWQ